MTAGMDGRCTLCGRYNCDGDCDYICEALVDYNAGMPGRPRRKQYPWQSLHPPLPSRRDRSLMGLAWKAPYWEGYSDQLFRPRGILATGAPPGSHLIALMIGTSRVLPLGPQPLAVEAFEHIERLDGSRSGAFQGRPHYDVVEPGILVQMRVHGPDDAPLGPPATFTLWGDVARYV